MKDTHTDITIVLDRSGSMASVCDDTIGGFNTFLAEQRKGPGTAAITLHQFDDQFETVIHAQDVKTAPDLTSKTFVPRGNTALLDAIGRAIKDTGNRLETMKDSERAGKVAFVIITDGFENASHEYDRAKVFEMIEHQRAKYSWEFVFLGANQDAIATAAGIAIPHANAMTYAANTKGTKSAYFAVASNLRQARSKKGSIIGAAAFCAADRDEQEKAGA